MPASCAKENDPKLRARLSKTRDAAAALLEDIEYLRKALVQDQPDRGELRRMSAILRRMLIEEELARVAAPRIGRFRLDAPDNKPFWKAAQKHPYMFFASGCIDAHSQLAMPITAFRTSAPSTIPMPDSNACKIIKLKLQGFLLQRVLCMNGEWVNRKETIKFVANVTSGVHSGEPTKKSEQLLALISHCVAYTKKDSSINIAFTGTENLPLSQQQYKYDRDAINPVLAEIMATSHFVISSDDIKDLEVTIAREVYGRG